MAQDGKTATPPPSQVKWDTLPVDLIRSGAMGTLNPAWVECLMGFPPGWTMVERYKSRLEEIAETAVVAGLDVPEWPPSPAGHRFPAKRSTNGSRRAQSRGSGPTQPAT